LELANRGYELLLVARRQDLLQEIAAVISKSGSVAFAHACDVTDETAVKQLVENLNSRGVRLDCLINNAGKELVTPLQIQKRPALDDLFNLNVISLVLFTKSVLKLFGPEGAIVNLASLAAIQGAPGMSAYAASKGAIVAFTRTLALELASRKLRVNAVAPGIVRTEMTERMFCKHDPASMARMEASYPLGFGEPEDVAKAVAFLAGSDARWITGQTLVVDGGYSA
jgi:3-oxoacyl-[acyl-carrier protein] reductase